MDVENISAGWGWGRDGEGMLRREERVRGGGKMSDVGSRVMGWSPEGRLTSEKNVTMRFGCVSDLVFLESGIHM